MGCKFSSASKNSCQSPWHCQDSLRTEKQEPKQAAGSSHRSTIAGSAPTIRAPMQVSGPCKAASAWRTSIASPFPGLGASSELLATYTATCTKHLASPVTASGLIGSPPLCASLITQENPSISDGYQVIGHKSAIFAQLPRLANESDEVSMPSIFQRSAKLDTLSQGPLKSPPLADFAIRDSKPCRGHVHLLLFLIQRLFGATRATRLLACQESLDKTLE